MVDQTDGQELMDLLVKEIRRRLRDEPQEMKAADFEMVRKLLQDNSITLASVRRGEMGEFAQRVAESFPFDDGLPGPQFNQ